MEISLYWDWLFGLSLDKFDVSRFLFIFISCFVFSCYLFILNKFNQSISIALFLGILPKEFKTDVRLLLQKIQTI